MELVRYEAPGGIRIRNLADIFRAHLASREEFWRTVPLSSAWLFYAGVFCLFSTVTVVGTMADKSPVTPIQIAVQTVASGLAAVLIAIVAVRRKIVWIPVIAVVEIVVLQSIGRSSVLNSLAGEIPAPPPVHALALIAVSSIAAAWTFLMIFISREGVRYFRVHTEMSLAREIHQALVPEIHRSIGEFEIYGASLPTGEVGGDLVDLVEDGSSWTAYVADVSGHGVSPGVLMAMFKTAVRSWMLAGSDVEHLLDGVHRSLYPLKTSNMFVTAGLIQSRGEKLMLLLAGHPPLLHYQRSGGQVCEYPSQDLPLGILPEQSFTPRPLQSEPGDILVLLTDGFTETSDRHENELGLEPLKLILRQSAELPLPELFQKMRTVTLAFGKQVDDQTMLLVRRANVS